MKPIPKAIEILGGLTAAGKKLGVTKSVVYNWRDRDKIPAPYCPMVELLTGVKSEQLNASVNWSLIREASAPK
jgi:DNA-binding transcriptional regulator YdaS (Cro superfamily)